MGLRVLRARVRTVAVLRWWPGTRGTARHSGAGGIDHWFDFHNDIVGVCFELVTEVSPMLEPISAIGHRFQDVITAAVVD